MHLVIVRAGGLALALTLLAACAVPQPSVNEAKQFDTPPQIKAQYAAEAAAAAAKAAPPEAPAEAPVEAAPTEPAPAPNP